jgi:ABC-2 type transport system ATP-binding protein
MSAVAEEGLSVVLSSHVVSELERVANYLIVLNAGRVQIASEIDELVQSHCLITGPTDEVDLAERDFTVIEIHRGDRQSRLLVRSLPTNKVPNTWEVTSVTLEELILAYLRDPGSSMISATTESTAASIREVTA